ncbi:retropepsin-like aspartic protease family protein [Falsigemmobacter faecalis]|uniref:TIGR02281 family clan AA aspartic protease n=1 Tax=Falsigemmobacter faecalis TaxID=2488730 RepID=A0A3P3DEA8_9RHOB|nr:TIGR02281 family clan AA aspartic protease [Falsigemmobacter faecalis]RRH72600.1 TIGR02281 family clan AA aspartic protease [Falsigemmobacter faecalis]
MFEDNLGRLIYLVLLLGALGGWALVEARGRFGQFTRQALAWVMIFGGLAAGYGLVKDINFGSQQALVSGEARQLEIKRSGDGHYYLALAVDGVPVRFMVDTGASSIVLSDRDTDRLNIERSKLAFLGQARTANGIIRTAQITLRNVTLEGQAMGDLQASVGDGPLGVSLLGMEFLNRFSRVEIARDRLILTH